MFVPRDAGVAAQVSAQDQVVDVSIWALRLALGSFPAAWALTLVDIRHLSGNYHYIMYDSGSY